MTNHPSNKDPIKPGLSVHESGENLQQLVDRLAPLPWALVRWFALQISELLEPLHAKGLVHGEISLEAIYLTRPWPENEVILFKGTPAPGNSSGDLQSLGEMMERLLSNGKASGNDFVERAPEAERIISALAAGSIPDVQTLSNILLDSLDAESEAQDLPSHAPEAIHKASRKLTPVSISTHSPRNPVSRKITVAAAALILVGAGSYFIFKPGAKKTSGRTEEVQSAADRIKEPLLPSNADANQNQSSSVNAKELEAKELAAKELAAKDQAAKDQAAKEQAVMEQAAKDAAREKAMKEKVIQDIALISKNEKIIEDSQASPEEKEQAFSVLLSLAKEENVKAIELCGAAYWQGNGVPKDRAAARIWFEKGASLGNARSMLGLGYCYDQAIGSPQDMTKAVEWWTKAANLGYEVAMSRLGDHYYLNSDSKNIKKAMEWWQKAADAKSPSADAMTNLGIIYAKGIETGKDLQKAMEYWQKAADLGAPEAMTELGIVYFNGEIKGKDADAFPYFQKAAEAGSIRAMYGLETCFRNGIGTEKNPVEADKWGRIASEKQKAAGR